MAVGLRRLVEARRYIEALYFGLTELQNCESSEGHFLVGLSCCAFTKPLAEFERTIHYQDLESKHSNEAPPIIVGKDTELVLAALRHFLRVSELEPAFSAPQSLRELVSEIRKDVVDYAGQDFRGLGPLPGKRNRRIAAWQTVVMIEQFEVVGNESQVYQSSYPYVQARQWLQEGRVFA
jgi:hypothetical protein